MSKEITVTISDKTILKLLTIFGWPIVFPYRLFCHISKTTRPTVKGVVAVFNIILFVLSLITAFGSVMSFPFFLRKGGPLFPAGFLIWVSVSFVWLTYWIDNQYLGGWLD